MTDTAGKPEPDAVVLLFNRQNRLLQRSATDAVGSFAFGDLLPDLYSVQVSLASFVPAMRDRILIKPGMRSVLAINLSKVFSSVQVVSMTPLPGGLMTDTWKWTLRTDDSLRPVLRLLPPQPAEPSSESHESIFTDSRGLIRVSAIDGADAPSAGDLGTQFAFATSLYGDNHLAVAGDLGYISVSGTPSAAIRTTYSRDFAGTHPTVSVTMRQFYFPSHMGQTPSGQTGVNAGPGDSNLPVLRTMGASFSDRTEIADSLEMEYGFELDSISLGNHLQYFSPWAKLTRTLGNGDVDFTWTSGNGRPKAGMTGFPDQDADMQGNLAALGVVPQVTLRDGAMKVQGGTSYELGLSERFGSREYRVSAYDENVSNATLTVASPESGLFAGDLLPDMMSAGYLFNFGQFQSSGYMASVTQDLGENYRITLVGGSSGVMTAGSNELAGASAADLRSLMSAAQRPALTLRASGTVKRTGSWFAASYEWTDYRSAVPGPVLTSQSVGLQPGLNLAFRQPIPTMRWIPGRVEASAELRNLLAQGYVPLTTSDGQQLLLVNTPRSFRGGLAFIF